jgi:RNA polymerase primary sigma factor
MVGILDEFADIFAKFALTVGDSTQNDVMLAEQDQAVVGRIVRRAGAFLDKGEIRRELLEDLFDMFGAEQHVREAVIGGLRATGTKIVGERTAQEQPLMPATSTRALETTPAAIVRPVVPSTPRSATSRAPISATDAARTVLEVDRRSGKPWRRLLTAQQEVGLATLMREQGQSLDIPLPKGFRRSLDSTDPRAEAFDALFLHNRGLVWSTISRYMGHGLDSEDLEQSGYEGLRRAVEMFDGSMGLKFSTYATHWINQSMSRAVANEGRVIRIPVHKYEQMQRVLAARNRLMLEGGRAPLFDICAATELPPEKVVECLRLSAGVVSLDAPIGDDTSLLELLENNADPDADPMALVLASDLREEFNMVIDMLAEREAAVIRMRFGFDGDEPMTLDAIGQVLGVTRERVRQIEKKAKERLELFLADVLPQLALAA